jgi:hypothetical protein
MKALRNTKPPRSWAAARALLALSAACAFGQAAPAARPQSRCQILNRVEAEAAAYEDGVAEIPLRVRQTVRDFDSTGRLKKTRHYSYRYTFEAVSPRTGNVKRTAVDAKGKPFRGPDLADGITFPFIFLPGSIEHYAIHLETPKTGLWILHLRDNPCIPGIKVHHTWMGASFTDHCLEGDALLEPGSDIFTKIRLHAVGLPVSFHTWPWPRKVVVQRFTSEISFRLLKATARTPARLVPVKAEYVITSNRGRTVIDKVFEVVMPHSQVSGSP